MVVYECCFFDLVGGCCGVEEEVFGEGVGYRGYFFIVFVMMLLISC